MAFCFSSKKWGTIIFLHSVLLTMGYSQNIPLEVKEQFLNNFKIATEDTVSKRIEVEKPFVIGRQHHLTGNNINHPYFSEYPPVTGSLVFNNRTYKVDGLQYDIKNDKLVYRYYNSNFEINCVALDENFIPQFSIYNSTFRYFRGLKTKSGRQLKDGYYEVVYDGNIKFLVRWEKTETFEVNEAHKFNASKSMLLLKDGLITTIKNKAQLLAQLDDKKPVVKKYIKHNHIMLKLKNPLSVAEVLRYYESLFQ